MSQQEQIETGTTPPEVKEESAPSRREQETMSSNEALARIREGKEIKDARIERLVFKGTFTEKIRLVNVTLVQPRFDGATFEAEVLMNHSTIDRPHFGNQSTFNKGWDLTGSTLKRWQMLRLTIRGLLQLEHTVVHGKFLINQCKIELIRLWEARFHGWAELKKSEFFENADFRSFHADEGFVLYQCEFHKSVLFRGSAVHKKMDFTTSQFHGILDLSKMKLHDYVYMESIVLAEESRLAFGNIVGDRILIRPDQLDGRLLSEEKEDYLAAMHEYAFFKRVYETLHHYDREDWAFYRFKVNQRRCCDRSWWKPWTKVGQFLDWLVLDHGCGYCTNPYRAIRTALLLILLFALLYSVNIEVFEAQSNRPFDEKITTFRNRAMISLFQSVAAFTSGLGGPSEMPSGWIGIPLMIEALLGLLLWGLFIVAFSRKVIR